MFFFSSEVSNKDDNNHKNNSNDIITKDISQYQSWLDNSEFHKFTIENTTDGSLGLTKEFKSFIIENDNSSMNYGENKSYEINKILEQLSMELSSLYKLCIFTIKLGKWLCKKDHIIYDITNYYNLIESNMAKYIDNIADIDDIKVHNDILNRENKFLDLSLKKNNKFYDLGDLDGLGQCIELITYIKEQSKNCKYCTEDKIIISTIRNFINRCYKSLEKKKSPVIHSEMIELFHKYFNKASPHNILYDVRYDNIELLDICKTLYCLHAIVNDFNSTEQSNSLEFFVDRTILQNKIYNLLFIKDGNNIKYSSLLLEIIDYYNKKINVNSDEFTKNAPSKIHKYIEHLKKIREYQSWLDNSEFHKFTIENTTDGSLGLRKEFKSFIIENDSYLYNDHNIIDNRVVINKILEKLSSEISSPYELCIFNIKLNQWIDSNRRKDDRPNDDQPDQIIYDNLVMKNIKKYIDIIKDIDDIEIQENILKNKNKTLKVPIKINNKQSSHLNIFKTYIELIYYFRRLVGPYKGGDEQNDYDLYKNTMKSIGKFINRCYKSLENNKSTEIYTKILELFDKYFYQSYLGDFISLAHDCWSFIDNDFSLVDVCKILYCFYIIGDNFYAIERIYSYRFYRSCYELVLKDTRIEYTKLIDDILLNDNTYHLLFIKKGENVQYTKLTSDILDYYKKKSDLNNNCYELVKSKILEVKDYSLILQEIKQYEYWLDNNQLDQFSITNITDISLELRPSFKKFILNNSDKLLYNNEKHNDTIINKILTKVSLELPSLHELYIFTIKLLRWLFCHFPINEISCSTLIANNIIKYTNTIKNIDDITIENNILKAHNDNLKLLNNKLELLYDKTVSFYFIDEAVSFYEWIELINHIRSYTHVEYSNNTISIEWRYNTGDDEMNCYKILFGESFAIMDRLYNSLKKKQSTMIYSQMVKLFNQFFEQNMNTSDKAYCRIEYFFDFMKLLNNNNDTFIKDFSILKEWQILYFIHIFSLNSENTLINNILLGDMSYKLLFIKDNNDIQYTPLTSQILDYYKNINNKSYELIYKKLLEIKEHHSKNK